MERTELGIILGFLVMLLAIGWSQPAGSGPSPTGMGPDDTMNGSVPTSMDSPVRRSLPAMTASNETRVATFAEGCFWCIEAAFMHVDGVRRTISGYAGGRAETATYHQVSTGTTDHREAVRVVYEPANVTYRELLDVYWRSIDPTDPGGQFADRGPQYTTAIYVHSRHQFRLANRTRWALEHGDRFSEPIVTEIVNYTTFFRAEDYHQNYSVRNTYQYRVYERASGRAGFLERVWGSSPLG